MYLLGDFCVKLDGVDTVITILPDVLKVGDITNQGLPFYSGKIKYMTELKGLKCKNVVINAEGFEGVCLKVVNGVKSEMIAWAPYEANITELVGAMEEIELELVLTRRNTFGPLHQNPLLTKAYGPGNFVTEGDKFAEEYMLIPQGLMKTPKLFEIQK